VADPKHHTNVHLFHHVAYPPLDENGLLTSFFDPSVQDLVFTPIDPAVHKPFSMQQFWNKKLRWVTLGGQYDWTNKVYPQETPPAFPSDIKQLLEDIFPIKAEAAILNLYSPGDTLSLHRDVSEECNRPLVSISLGCDAIFIVGLDGESPSQEPRVATLRLRSGDAVLMSGASRFAWHGVPKVVKGTCPEWMQDWPGGSGRPVGYQKWKGWMTNKRINLNVRQMFADSS
jgi:DNA alkylation damage repair protein AlkB